jgi:hypothetical protein
MNPVLADPQEKAFEINRTGSRYGTFAEIGAGQEVARWFFHVGGAAGTVAKTMSAYDMAVSDAIYGPTKRYVSRERLQAMLDHEWGLLLQRLDATRGERTMFFVFADTVATRSHTHREDGHGWLGLRFQTGPRAEPSEIVIHTRLWDHDNARQQEALGILGVNLIHAGFHFHAEPDRLLTALLDNLTRDRVEVDMVRLRGPAFAGVDHRLLSLQLVHQRLTNAAFFTATGEVVEPAEILYRQPVLLERGSFRPVTNVNLALQQGATAMMRADPALAGQAPVLLMEMTLRQIVGSQPAIDHTDFLARVDTLSLLGHTVMISNYSRFHNVTTYLRRYTGNRIGMVMGVPTLARLFEEQYYTDLEGGILEAFGRLFCGPVTVYVYPRRNPETGELVTATNFRPPTQQQHLYAHLLEGGFIQPVQEVGPAPLQALPADVLRLLQTDDPAWETLVPPAVVERIKQKRLFGYQPRATTTR